MRGSVSGSEWRDTLALTHCLPLNSLSGGGDSVQEGG